MSWVENRDDGTGLEVYYQSEGGNFYYITGFHIKNPFPWTVRKSIDRFLENGLLDGVIDRIKEEDQEECDCPDCQAERAQKGQGIDAVSNQPIHQGMGFDLGGNGEDDEDD